MKYINIAPAANKTSYFPLSFPVLPRQTVVIHPDIHSGKYPDSYPDNQSDNYSASYPDNYSADQSDNYPDSYPDNQPDGLRPAPSSCRIVTLILSYVGFYVLGFFRLIIFSFLTINRTYM